MINFIQSDKYQSIQLQITETFVITDINDYDNIKYNN